MRNHIQADSTGCTAPKAPHRVKVLDPMEIQGGPHHALSREKAQAEFDHVEWAERAWQALIRGLERCPAKFDPQERRQEFIDRYARRSAEGTAMKWLKFHTVYVFGYAANQTELPAPPGPFEEGERPGRPVGGSLGRALQKIMSRGRAGNRRCLFCAWDVLMSKLGFPPAPPAFVEQALQDHKAALSRVAPERTEESETILSAVYEKIDEIVRQVFRGVEFEHQDPVPSLRACYEAGLKDGGALGQLLGGFGVALFGEVELYTPKALQIELEEPLVEPERLVGMMWDPHNGLSELRLVGAFDLVAVFQDWVDRLWVPRLAERLEAVPCPILEPLKVRTITKGQAAEYYRTLELQRMMHGAMRKHPVFEFIGHPISDASFAKAFGTKADLAADEFYVSGDYKAATDNLDPRLTRYAWESICRQVWIPWEGHRVLLRATPYFELGVKALTRHELIYSRHPSRKALWEAKTEEEMDALKYDIVQQTWGQLMGSPMSFPILCLVNCAATLAALDRPFTRELSVRINGDDIGFKATTPEYERWKQVTKQCGLEFSLGKNYTSRDFLVLNSELRMAPEGGQDVDAVPTGYLVPWTLTGRNGPTTVWVSEYSFVARPKTWRLVGFLNQSILYHTIRKGMKAGEQKDVYWTDLGDLARECLRGIPDRDQWGFLSIFLEQHRSVLREMPPLANLWFPRALGGAGVPIPAGKTFESLQGSRDPQILLKQRRLAAYMACNPAARQKVVQRPSSLVGPVNEVFKDIRNLSDQQVPPVLIKNASGPGEVRPGMKGQTFLAYVIRGLADTMRDSYAWSFQDGGGDRCGIVPTGDLVGEELGAAHRGRSLYLNQKYRNWTRSALTTSLEPMSLDKIHRYTDQYRYLSYIEILSERASDRLMDRGREDPTFFLPAGDVLSLGDVNGAENLADCPVPFVWD